LRTQPQLFGVNVAVAQKRRGGSVKAGMNWSYSAFRSGLVKLGQTALATVLTYVCLPQTSILSLILYPLITGKLTRGSEEERWKRYSGELEEQRFQVWSSEPWASCPIHFADLCLYRAKIPRASTNVKLVRNGSYSQGLFHLRQVLLCFCLQHIPQPAEFVKE
jgi:hypothetical protein